MMRFSWSLQGANSAGLPRSCSAFQLWVSPCLWYLMLPSQLTSICSKNFSCGTGLRALTACLRIPDWPRRLGSNFAHITAGLGGPKMQLAHLIGSHQWEMPSCTGFSGFAWALITSQLRRAAISTCLGPVVSATCAILMHGVMRGICCLSALPWQISGCNSLHSCCRVLAS